MRKIFKNAGLLILFVFPFSSYAQNTPVESIENGGEYPMVKNDGDHPCITAKQYEIIDKRCAENGKLLRSDKAEKSLLAVALIWPIQAAAGFTDCSHYILSAYVDQNTSAGAMNDYNCGTNTYDGHRGTDMATWPFPFYKMDNDQVEVIAAASGTILDKDDGNFDRNCSSNSLPANYVIIQHADGSCALYWHMKSGSVTTKAIGQTVVAGEYLGVIGSSGSSTGPHLHFEVWTGTTSSTYNDPYFGTCNTLNSTSWWAAQKPYSEPAILKASVHTTDVVIPGCPTTETPNESTSYQIPFQGQGLPPGAAKFYIFIRDMMIGTTVNCSILNPGGSTFNSWTFLCNYNYNGSYWGWTKYLPTIAGTYTFQATYYDVTCSQNFDITTSTGITANSGPEKFQVYPNPANDILNISSAGIANGNYKFVLKNLMGQALIEDDVDVENRSIQKTISISELPKSIYFLTIDNEKTTVVKKIIKQN